MDTLSRLVNSELRVEKERVREDITLSHLAKQGVTDDDIVKVRDMLRETELWIEGRIADIIKGHPAYPWFSKVRGVGPENIAKCIGPLRIKPAQAYRKNKETKKVELVDLPYATVISDIWAFSGMAPGDDGKAMKPKEGEVLRYDKELRSLWWRLGSSILKAGLRQKCSKCGALVGQKSTEEHLEEKHKGEDIGQITFTTVATSKFAGYYLKEKEKEVQKCLNKGWKIIPALELPKKEGKRYEPEGIISEGHVHNRALRKMIKLFQACLFLTWREAEGLPPTKPYAIDKLGHDSMIDPWKMVDR